MKRPSLCRRWLLASTAIGLAGCLGFGELVRAADECGAIVNGQVTCTSAGNNYTSGITYNPAEDLTMVVQDGVTITPSSGNEGIDISFSAPDLYDLDLRLYDSDEATDITTTGLGAEGIHIYYASGAVDIDSSGVITTDGVGSSGINVYGTNGNVNVTLSGAITTGLDHAGSSGNSYSDGIYIGWTIGDIAVDLLDSSSITTYGATAQGIQVWMADNVAITADGTISTEGNHSKGIYVREARGAVDVNGSGSIITQGGSASGIYIGDTTGNVTVSADGSISTYGNYSSGILLANTSGDVTVTAGGTIVTRGSAAHGIYSKSSTGNVTITSSGTIITEGGFAHGIAVEGATGYKQVKIIADGTIETQDSGSAGISVANSLADIDISAKGSIYTDNEASHGIQIQDTTGTISVTTSGGLIRTGGPSSRGIYVINSHGDVSVDAGGTIKTYDKNSRGMELRNNDSDVYVTLSGSIITALNYAGRSSDKAFASGIALMDTRGLARVELKDGSSISTFGRESHGVYLYSNQGNAQVTAFGSIATEGDYSSGISILDTVGNVTVSTGGTILTEGRSAHGVHAMSTDGDVAIDLGAAGSITTHGDQAHGIVVTNTGAVGDDHDVTIDVAGSVSANGEDADAVRVRYTYGDVLVTISGSVTGGAGGGAAIALDNPNATSSRIVIADTGRLGALSDLVIEATEPVSIDNAGTITGYVLLGSGDDIFTNSKIWFLRNYADTDGDGERDTEDVARADFGSGDADRFDNFGTLSLLKGTSSLWQGEITGLETFNHSGIIDLQDDIAGDTLSISGNFVSNGGSLLLDVALDDGSSSPQADVLTLTKASLGSDATQITIANAGGHGGQTSGNGILLVDAQEESDERAFELAERVIAGAYEYQLHYDAAAFDWYLRSLESTGGMFTGTEEYPALMTAALLGFGADWSALHNRIAEERWQDEEGPRIEPASWTAGGTGRLRPWLHVTGARQEIGSDTPFDQQVIKLEAGIDGRLMTAGGARVLFGGFAGTGQSDQHFQSSTTEAEANAALAGLYAGYRSGAFYGNAILKYEHHWAKLRSDATADDGSSYGVDVLGASLESGYRVSFGRAYVQPRLRLSYAHAWETSLKDASGETISLLSADSLTGEAAARLGFDIGSGEIYVDGGVRHEFRGETEAEVSGLSFTDALPGSLGFVSGGFVFSLLADKLLLSAEAGYAKGDAAEEITATAALRIVY